MNKTNKIIILLALCVVVLGVAYAAYTTNNSDITALERTKSDETLDTKDSLTDTVPEVDSNNPPPTVVVDEEEQPPVTDKDVKKEVVDRLAIALSLTTKNACEAKGGSWKPMMSGVTYFCVLPTSDAGNSCTDDSQCESWCQAPRGSTSGASVVGACAGFTHASCSQHVTQGKATAEMCE